jgi:hypothetical protein
MKNSNQALEVIKQALNVATTKGAFNLMDAQNILEALSILETPEPPKLDKEE